MPINILFHKVYIYLSIYLYMFAYVLFILGNLAAQDVGESVKNMDDPYANEPRRHITLRPSSKQPFNAEPPLSLLVDNLITPK